MGFDRRFALGLGLRLALLIGAALALAWSVERPGLGAARLVAGLLTIGAGLWLWSYITRTNVEVARFVEALAHGDLSQSFAPVRSGGGFEALGAALDGATRRLRAERTGVAEESLFHAGLVDEVPVALLTINDEGRVELANKAARKLFRHVRGARAGDFAGHGEAFVAALEARDPPPRQLVRTMFDGAAQRAMLTAADIRSPWRRPGRALRLLSVQPIQSELNAVEIAAQADLVRVLTHEIMNSMTPVTSLAESAARLIAQVQRPDDPDLADARLAVETLARRAGGIMRFVESYREFSRPPTIRPRRFAAKPWADELARLFAASREAAGVALAVTVEPADLVLDADPDLLAQVVINLVKNGAEAAAGHAGAPRVALAVGLLPGGRTLLAVEDNGPGVARGQAEEIFLPFYTTKDVGTGVGLSLARRIVVAHGGTLAMAEGGAGARFEIRV